MTMNSTVIPRSFLNCCVLMCLIAYERMNDDDTSCIAKLNITVYETGFIEERISTEAMADDRPLILVTSWVTLSQMTL